MSEEKKTADSGADGAAETPTNGARSAMKLDSFDKEAGEAAAAAAAAAETAPQQMGATPDADAPRQADAPEAAQQGAEAAADDPATLQARISDLEAQLAAKEDQHLRAVAEIQNIRRRSERDRREAETFGGTKLARDLLAVFDNLDEALRQASDDLKTNEAGFFNGVELTRKVMLDGLGKHQITQVTPEIGEKFDPNRHQAMYEAPAPGAEPGSVIQVMQSGFMIADRLLRPAMVGVASAASGPSGGAEAAKEPAGS